MQVYDRNPIQPTPLSAALEHAGLLHPTGTQGRVTVARIDESGRWREKSYRANDLPDVIAEMAGRNDGYITMNRFMGPRQMLNLYELGALWVDLDYHKVYEYRDVHPLGVLDDVLVALDRARMPAPTLAIFSGRGLYVVWLHTPVPRLVTPRWNAAQKELWKVLEPFGADSGALDAARVLRIPGTLNSKSGAVVERIAPVGEVWAFEDLLDEILPLGDEEVAEVRDIRVARAAKKPSERLVTPPKGFTPGTLWTGRFYDLHKLREMRFVGGKLPPGQRDPWMLIAATSLSWFVVPDAVEREIKYLSRRAADWSDSESVQRTHAVLKRAGMAARGEKIEWPPGSGQMVDPRYRYKNSTIIDLLEITPDEERDMDVLISSDERMRRDRERKERERREAGMVSRAEYLDLANRNRSEVHRMTLDGMSVKEISEALKLSKIRVKEIRRENREKGLGEVNDRGV